MYYFDKVSYLFEPEIERSLKNIRYRNIIGIINIMST